MSLRDFRLLSPGGVGLVWWLAAPRTLAAQQLSAALDAGASVVRYDGFLASGAAALTPTLRLETRHATLGARGTYLLFESGNRSVQGLVSGDVFSPPFGPFRADVGLQAGASSYAGVSDFASVLSRTRLHLLGLERGAWVGGMLGKAVLAGEGRPTAQWAAGAWARRGAAWVQGAWTGTAVGDTLYWDAEGRLRWRTSRFELEGGGGARVASRGGGRGVYGEFSGTLWLSAETALSLSGGRYPSDPVRGNVAGRYVTASLRIGWRQRVVRPPLAPGRSDAVSAAASSRGDGFSDVSMELRAGVDGAVTLRFRAARVDRVEVMGDFTDWLPVACARAGPGAFELVVRLARGFYRYNVRVNGGPWGVPADADRGADEFGGLVGVIVVP